MLGNARMTKRTGLAAFMLLAAYNPSCAQDGAWRCNCTLPPSPAYAPPQDDPFWDEIGRYFQRIPTSSLVSGDAKEVNAVTQIIDPWPRYARDRRIPVNARRMVGAMDRYQNPKLLGVTPPTLAPIIIPGSTGAGGGAGGGAMGGGGYGGGP